MMRGQRIVEVVRPDLQGEATPADRHTSLELVEPDVNAGLVEPLQCPLDAMVGNEGVNIALGDPGMLQQAAVRAVDDSIDRVVQCHEEALATVGEAGAEVCIGGHRVDRTGQEARQPERKAPEQSTLLQRARKSHRRLQELCVMAFGVS